MRFYPFVHLWDHGLPARAGQRWLSTRFHPHLLAAAAGCWGVAVPVRGSYYDVKHEALLAHGSGWALLHPGRDEDAVAVPHPHADAAGFGEAATDLAAAKLRVAEAIYSPGGP